VEYSEISKHERQITSRFQIENQNQRKRILILVLGVSLGFVFCNLRFAQAASPATQSSTQIPTWFADLANRDAKVRDQARYNLMGITRDDLATLRQLVQKNRPLAPSQAVALRDIVMQVYLAGETYQPFPGSSGFLGVVYQGTVSNLAPDPPDDELRGVVVINRMPGFCSFRALQDGDVIVGVVDDAGQEHPVRAQRDLGAAITSCRAGDTVHMRRADDHGGYHAERATRVGAAWDSTAAR
jgi:hypothetical protein